MSLREFWISVRTGARLLAPRTTVDSPKLDAGAIEQLLRGATLWLSPRAVAGFNEADFSFLPDAERAKLSKLVSEFRQIAAQVPPTAPASKDQIEAALPRFRDIITMMEFDRHGDAEAYQIGKQIERVIENRRPPELVELRFNTGIDSTGDPGLWIWAILKDEAATKTALARTTRSIRELLEAVAREIAPTLWPYIGFRTVSEQADLEAAKG